jgi:hypothetical protein
VASREFSRLADFLPVGQRRRMIRSSGRCGVCKNSNYIEQRAGPGTGLIHEFPVGSEKGRQFLRIVPDRAIPARIDVASAKGYGKFPMRQRQGNY